MKFRVAHALVLSLLCTFPVVGAPNDVTVRSELRNNDTYQFYASNPAIIPQFLVLDFPTLVNLTPSVPLPLKILLPPSTSDIPLLSLAAISTTGRIQYSSRFTFAQGDPNAVHDDSHAYLFPFAHGTKHLITQGNFGKFTHFDDNTYAFDFDLEIGTEVHAARGGLVVEVKEDSNRGGPSASYNNDANYILVMHDDGSFGNYVHLRLNGALVNVGDTVSAGQLIAYSGNTGRSSGPHLHFDVRMPTEQGRMESIPIRFLNNEGIIIDGKEGEYYYAYNPDMPPFSVSFGKDLVNEDYANYRKAIPSTAKIDIRADQVDSTYVLFAQNPGPGEITLTYTLKLVNFVSTMPIPHSVVIPAQTEVFLCIIHPQNAGQGGSYQISYSYRRVN